MFQQLGIRFKLSAFVVLITLIASVAYTLVILKVRRDSVTDDVDEKLLMAAQSVQAILPPGYIDDIRDKASVSKDVFDRIVARNDRLCASTGLQYLWSVMLLDGKVVFTSATHSVLTDPKSNCAAFLEPHTNPAPYQHAFDTMQPEYTTFHDKWGAGRMILIPEYDRYNRKHLFAASVRESEFNLAVHRTIFKSLLIGLAIAVPAIVVALFLARSLTRPLVKLSDAARRMAAGDLNTDLNIGGSREVAALAASFDAMRQSIRDKIDAMKDEIETRRKAEAQLTDYREHLKLLVQERTAELNQSQRMLQLVLDSIPAGVFWKDRNSVYLGCNRMAALNAGFADPRDLVGTTDLDLPWKAYADRYRADDQHVMQTGQPKLHYEEPIISATGQHIWLRISKIPLRDSQDNIIGVMGSWEDITERKKAEDALRESEARLRYALDAASAGSWTWDAVTGVTSWDDPLRRLYDFGACQSPTFDAWAARIHPEDRPRILSRLQRMQTTPGDNHWAVEFRSQNPDGVIRWHYGIGHAERGPSGEIRKMMGIDLDITDRRQAEEAIRRLNEELEERVMQRTAQLAQVEQTINRSPAIVIRWKPGPPWSVEFITDNIAQFGYTAEEFIFGHHDWNDITHPDDTARINAEVADYAARGIFEFTQQYRLITRDGQIRWIEDRNHTVRDAAGAITGYEAIALDITTQKLAELHLRDALDRLSLAQEAGGLGVFDWDITANTTIWTPETEALYGLPPGTFAGTNFDWEQHIHPDDRPAVRAQVQKSLENKNSGHAEFRIIHPDGSIRWIADSWKVICDEKGEPVRMVGANVDVTERKLAEQALAQSEDRFRSLIEHLPIGIAVLCDFKIVYANPAAARMYGAAQSQDLLDMDVLAAVPPERRPAVIADLETLLDRQQPVAPHEGAIQRLDGTRLDVEVGSAPFRHNGRPAALHFFVDITERKKNQDQLRESQRHYAALAERNQRLALEVEHRVRNNLTGLLGLISVMKNQSTDVPTFATTIESRLMAMAHTQKLLAESQWGRVDLRELILSTLLAMKWMSRHNTPMDIDGPPVALPPAMVMPLALILVEWFTNSCKHGAHTTPHGRLCVRWSIVDDSPHPALRITWNETGGPPITQAPAASLGTSLIKSFVIRELHGKCRLNYPPAGADHEILVPLPA